MTAEPAGWGGWGGGLRAPGRASRQQVVKRVVDMVGAGALLLVLCPLLISAMAAVRITSRGPVLFRQERVGRDGTSFVMLKLRTMQTGCADVVHREYVEHMLRGQARSVDGLYKLRHDPRVTRLGAWLRRSSIDELPQLWNVLRGEMSLVGPRPALSWESDLFPAWAQRRFEVRPGLSGLWQVSGRNRLTMTEGLALDVRYVEEQSLRLDLVILLRTARAVLGREAC